MTDVVERKEDMSPNGKLVILMESDMDMVLAIIPDPEDFPHRVNRVEFCTSVPGGGGGRSPHTWHALRNLMEAMKKDNKESYDPRQEG